jgi:hypothetical protein
VDHIEINAEAGNTLSQAVGVVGVVGVVGRTPDSRTGHVYSNPVINWALSRLLTNFLGATGNRLNLTKSMDGAKFQINYNVLTSQQRE